ncbi:MAG: hypothetical protein GY928_25935 [Colwellia sp.]|nr:hypothetical protein [Colwellia sp.]
MKIDDSIEKMEVALQKKKEVRVNAINEKIKTLNLRWKKKNEKRNGLEAELVELEGQIKDLEGLLSTEEK